jgi:RHS repeat-associated protein
LNKGITDIQYNVLNLPSTVSFSDGSTITYTYGADGTKLRTVHKIGSTTTTTDYCGNVIYENGTQKLLLTEEGYINLAGTQQYHYYLKDHQGNNRVVINRSGTMEETNHYYPFGGVFATAGNTQPYKYNGKEFDTKKGLNWYDYGARHYDTALGRFMTNDRFAEKYYSMSPYQYGANSPVVNIDVNGDSIRICTETQSFGHTWISVGEGSNMTVYSYGRYNGTNKGQIEALIL